MNYRKQGLKALGLSLLAVLGLMAFAASGAQASGKVLVEGLTPPFTVGITGGTDALTSDRLWILNLNMELACPETTVTEGLLTSVGHMSATVKFGNCTVQGTTAAGALIGSSCVPNPNSVTFKVLALVILHEGNTKLTLDGLGGEEHKLPKNGLPYLLFTPPDGLTFLTVTNSDEECLLPESATVKGCFVAKFHTTGDQAVHLIDTRGMLSLFGCELRYGSNVAHLEGDKLLELTNSAHGNHKGLKWGVE